MVCYALVGHSGKTEQKKATPWWSFLFGVKLTHHSVGNHSTGSLAELFQTHCEDECGDKEKEETGVWVNGESGWMKGALGLGVVVVEEGVRKYEGTKNGERRWLYEPTLSS